MSSKKSNIKNVPVEGKVSLDATRVKRVAMLKNVLARFKSISMHGVTIYEGVITPGVAELMLTFNTKNRHMTRDWTTYLAGEMSSGSWGFTGESVKFDRNWLLLDKQHTLQAIVSSGSTVPMLISCGYDPLVFGILDQNLKRTLKQTADRESIHIENKDTLFLKYVYLDKIGKIGSEPGSGRDVCGSIEKWNYRMNSYKVLAMYMEDPSIKAAIDFVNTISVPRSSRYTAGGGMLFSRTALLYAAWKLRGICISSGADIQIANKYITGIISGLVPAMSIADLVRDRIGRMRKEAGHNVLLSNLKQYYLLCAGWNALSVVASGKRVSSIAMPTGVVVPVVPVEVAGGK